MSRRDFISTGYEGRLKFCSCNIAQIELLYRIVSEELYELHQCSLGLEVSLVEELQDVKPQV